MTGLQSPEEGLYQATTQTAGKVYVTLGSEDSLWIKDDHLCQQDAFSVNVVDTTGAGDVFHGAVALAMHGMSGLFFTDAPPPNSFCQLLSEENVELVVAEQEVS